MKAALEKAPVDLIDDRELRYVLYTRVSTQGQHLDENGNEREDASPEIQKRRCMDYIKVLNNNRKHQGLKGEYRVVHILEDLGMSGKNINRPGYKKLVELIEAREIGGVIATELSRLSRSVLDFLELVKLCEDNNVKIHILGLNLDTSTPFGRVIVIILVALAQFEREMTSLRTKENAIKRLLDDGKINGAGEILGLDSDPKKKVSL